MCLLVPGSQIAYSLITWQFKSIHVIKVADISSLNHLKHIFNEFPLSRCSVHINCEMQRKKWYSGKMSASKTLFIYMGLSYSMSLLMIGGLVMWSIEKFLFLHKKIFAYKDITENYSSGVPFRPNFVIFVVDSEDIRVIGDILLQESTHWYCFCGILVAYLCSLHLWWTSWYCIVATLFVVTVATGIGRIWIHIITINTMRL